MNRNNGHDWDNIIVLWVSMFVVVAVVITTDWANGTMEPVFGTLIIMIVAICGSELVGRK